MYNISLRLFQYFDPTLLRGIHPIALEVLSTSQYLAPTYVVYSKS